MKIIHAAVSMNPSIGVIKQMEWEQQAAFALGLHWTTVLHTGKSVNSEVAHVWNDFPKNKLLRYFSLRYKFYKWIEQVSEDYDLIILRFSVHDPWQTLLARRIGHKLLTVHHTKEEPELAAQPIIGKFKDRLEKVFGRHTLSNAMGFIAVTPEIQIYENSRLGGQCIKPSWIYPNGILTNKRVLHDDRSKDIPEIIFVASDFSPWQGLDKLIDEVLQNQAVCVIHIVGSLNPIDRQRCGSDSRFVLHGHLEKDDLFSLMGRAWCGLSSFALERKDMNQACTLKVREYLQMGLPVYAGHQDTGLPDGFAFYKQGAPNLNDMLAYAHQMRGVSRADVSAAAEPHISKASILSSLYAQLQTEIFPKLSSYAEENNAVFNEHQDRQGEVSTADVKLIAVTGASGFIGSALVQKLLHQGFKVRALTRKETHRSMPSLEWFVGDLQTKEDWSDFLQDVDLLIHTAAELNNTALMQAANVDGPLRMLDAALNCGVKRWVQLSSVGAYGSVSQGWVNEGVPSNPKGAYEQTKTLFDEALVTKLQGSSTQYCIVRPSNVYGPGMRNQSLNQMQRMLKKGWFAFIGTMGASANYVHVDDVVNAVVKGALHPAAANQTYIVSDWTTLENMVCAMAQAVKADQPNLRVPLWLAKTAAYSLNWVPKWPLTPSRVNALSNRSRYSTQKIEKELGWHVTIPVVLGVRQLHNK